jgi:hypothetical protein
MTTTGSQDRDRALTRVRRLLDAAGEVARLPDVVSPLVDSTGLSRQGVELGLSRYLETSASESDLDALVRNAAPSPHVHVILSANVFTAPLRALAVACAASASVSVRPSRRDPVLTRALVRAAKGLHITLDEDVRVSAVREGEIHVYGRDATVAAVRDAALPGVRVRAHGTGVGVAAVTETANLGDAARALADDVVVFDQRGCLSPRVVLVLGREIRGDEFIAQLGACLADLAERVPRGRLDATERRDAARYIETMSFAGRLVRGADFVVALAPAGGPLLLAPTGRHVHAVVARDLVEARELLRPIAPLVVGLGCDDEGVGAALLAPSARVRLSRLGRMQAPPLDGPVDLR